MLSQFRSRLTWKLFLSYLLVVLIGAAVLMLAAELAIPSSFDRHMVGMSEMMEGMADSRRMGRQINSSLFSNFRIAVREALFWAGLAALLAAGLASLLISRRVITPIKEMMEASQHIASGHFQERVSIPGDPLQGDELTQLALSFNRMADQLQKTETMRRQLIADVTHELRTPLTTIEGSLEGLIDGVLIPEPETYQQIHREADRLSRLVDDLQQLSRVEAEAFTLDLQPVSIPEILTTAADRLENQFQEKGVQLTVECEESIPPVLADEGRIEQVLINIIGNALQYTPGGGHVDVSVSADQDLISFQVKDTGIGIPPEYLPHIFTRFYRVDKSRSRTSGGSGIGLTIARHLVEAHGGEIQAESSGAGEGSTFTFTLPRIE